ncbi:MAG: sigma 54-interacting transcriptional regulator [Candidatus Desulfatibia sp.]|uniref:sigma-54 dependent transcriptional regulator n=1 Tax=Candidatus Desulfatibia sp. TaxID=3101189 RepID=UPI002F2D1C9C
MDKSMRILIIEDEEILRFSFKSLLAKEGYEVQTAEDYNSAFEIISDFDPDLIIADIILGKYTGIDILRDVKKMGLQAPVVMITGKPSIETASEAVRLGAYDYLPKPVEKEDLLKIAQQALRYKAIRDEKDRAQAEKEKYRSDLETIFASVQEGIVTVDSQMKVMKANTAFERICGMPQQEMVGRRFDNLPNKCLQQCRKVLEEALQTQKEVKAFRMECKHNERNQQVVLTSSPLWDHTNTFAGAVLVVRDITREHDLERKLAEQSQFQEIIGKSETMRKLYALLEDLAASSTTVLITGESGTGKELAANAIHRGGTRAPRPFVKVNCSALSDFLLESELFGHVKGAFTGALQDKLGRFEMADGGSILLDEIGDISPRIQHKLLRVLQETEFERVGDSMPIKVDVRIIASTNRDLKEMVRLGKFRQDLYYRLKVVEVKLPPLRERLDDIRLLLDHFCLLFNMRFNKDIDGVTDEAYRVLSSYRWPGNVRELENAMEHAFVLCHGRVITIDHLPPEIKTPQGSPQPVTEKDSATDLQNILRALKETGGNKAKAARLLGISRRTIYRKLSQL